MTQQTKNNENLNKDNDWLRFTETRVKGTPINYRKQRKPMTQRLVSNKQRRAIHG